jgi:hypothetical protein
MSALINALDNYTPTQIGENGHSELGWSNNIQEKICQFSFQLTRTKDEFQLLNLEKILRSILQNLPLNLPFLKVEPNLNLSLNLHLKKVEPNLDLKKEYLSILYKMIGHTRDIIDGKGEYTLTYMMIRVWYEYYPKLAFFALDCLVHLPFLPLKKVDDLALPFLKVEDHPYGSWKDIKYFCESCRSKGFANNHPLIQHCVKLLNTQIKKDFENEEISKISLAAKWAPREKSKFGWLYQLLSTHYFSNYILSANTNTQKTKAILKCNMDYRKILSILNKKIDTLQIKQCEKNWAEINFNNVTSISLSKQKKAFLNVNKKGQPRIKSQFDNDRNTCKENFNNHIEKATEGKIEIKGKRIGLNDFTKEALELIKIKNVDPKNTSNNQEINLLNLQWKNNSTQTKNLENMIALVDVSGSMDGEPLNAAISLGIRVAEKSSLGKRVLTFETNPKWVNLSNSENYVDMVKELKNAPWGGTTNFYLAMEMILDAIIKSKMAIEEIEKLVLVIFSDMQINDADSKFFNNIYDFNKECLYKTIQKKYSDTGIKTCGKPYPTPHILFWNLRSTIGFPVLSSQPNTTIMSGFSPALLNTFCDEGLEGLKTITPWKMLIYSLKNKRYQIMEDKIMEEY